MQDHDIPIKDNLSTDDGCLCSPFDDHKCGKPAPAPAPPPARPRFYLSGTEPKPNQCPYPIRSRDALAWGLTRMGIDVRHNQRAHTTEWRQEDGDWVMLNGRAAAYLRSEIQANYIVDTHNGKQALVFKPEPFTEALDAMLYNKEVDPLKEWLESLPPVTGRRKLQGALEACFDVHPEYVALARWASVFVCLGVVWRTFEPGTIMDEIPIISGPGGIGKTTFLRRLLPPEIPGLFASGLDLSGDAKAMVEALQGKAMVECGEMVGATRGDLAKIKDFLSRVDDGGVRLTWRRDPEPTPRRCVVVGTTDKTKFLPQDNNPRRFVPIRVGDGKAVKVYRFMEKHRNQLWAEAMEMYAKGTPARLPDNLKQDALDKARKAMKAMTA